MKKQKGKETFTALEVEIYMPCARTRSTMMIAVAVAATTNTHTLHKKIHILTLRFLTNSWNHWKRKKPVRDGTDAAAVVAATYSRIMIHHSHAFLLN